MRNLPSQELAILLTNAKDKPILEAERSYWGCRRRESITEPGLQDWVVRPNVPEVKVGWEPQEISPFRAGKS